MAQLSTDLQLPSPDRVSGNQPIQGNPVGPSALGGFANLAGNLLQGQQQRQRMDLELQDRAAKNAAEQGLYDAMASYDLRTSPTASVELEPMWQAPGEVINSTQRLGQVQNAENNGALPQGSTQLHLESTVASLFQQFPNQKAEIGEYLQGRGFDHYIFEDAKNSLALEQAHQASVDSGYRDQFDYAVKVGAISPDFDFAQGAQVGQKLMNAHAILAQQKDQAELIMKSRELDLSEKKFQLDQASQGATAALNQEMTARVGPWTKRLNNLMSGVLNDPDRISKMNEMKPQVITAIEQYRSAMIGKAWAIPGMRQENIDSLNKAVDQNIAAVNSVYNETFEVNKRSLDNMKTNFGLESGKAFPLYALMVQTFGQPAMNMFFGGNPGSQAMPKDIQDRMTTEFRNWKPGQELNGVVMNDAIRVMRGQQNLSQMSAVDARNVVPHLVATAQGAGNAIISGKATDLDKTNWHSSISNLADATIQLAPGTTDFSTFRKATYINSSPLARAALENQMNDPQYSDQAKAEMFATRTAAQKLLIIGTSPSNILTKNTVPTLASLYDGKSPPAFDVAYKDGRFQVVQNQAAYEAWRQSIIKGQNSQARPGGMTPAQRADYGSTPPPAWNQITNKGSPPAELAQKVDSLNVNLTHLVETSKYDPSIPTGANPLQLADHYAKGTPLQRPGPDKTQVKANDMWNQEAEKFRQDITGLTPAISTDPHLRLDNPAGRETHIDYLNHAADAHGVPKPVADFLVHQESGYDPKATSDNGKHLGLGQFDEVTAKRFGLIDETGDHRTDPHMSMDASMKYLSILHGKYGSWEAALNHYGTLSPRSFPGGVDGKAYKNAVAKARAAIGSADQQQATTANQ